MIRAWIAVAAVASGLAVRAENAVRSASPSYTAASVVNSANFLPGPLAPNGLGTVFGTDLVLDPTETASSLTRVRVHIGGLEVTLLYASATQINFIVPIDIIPGETKLRVVRQGVYGPNVAITVAETAPALFRMPGTDPWIIATHADYSLVTATAPARAGEIVILYAAGLGDTNPALPTSGIASGIHWLKRLADFRVLLNDTVIDTARVSYAGAAPGYRGLYQVNVRMPDEIPTDPEIQLAIGDQKSATGLKLPLR